MVVLGYTVSLQSAVAEGQAYLRKKNDNNRNISALVTWNQVDVAGVLWINPLGPREPLLRSVLCP